MAARYVDIPSIVQVIGCIYQNPYLLGREDEYFFNEDDFTEDFHKVLFGSIYNLYHLGAKEITINAIEDYLEQRPKKLAIYKANKGKEFLEKTTENIQMPTFDYYYQKMKKMTLLRMYNEKCGMDLSWLYDINNMFDTKKKQAQEDWLDETSLDEIANIIDGKIEDIKLKYVDDANGESEQAGEGAIELLHSLKETPEIGYPLYGDLINTVTRGARLKKFYLRSSATGIGKTRTMIADACNFACSQIYNVDKKKWEDNGTKEPTIFISTEQELDELRTMMIAFVSGVNEEHIINGEYFAGEWDRVTKAAKILKESELYIEQLPDFSLQDIENTIKKNIREHNVRYVCFDYIHTSMKILSEVSSKTGVKGLREDNILFMISIRLKDLCNEYGVFILTSTQLNADYVTADQYDQNLLRGAKAIADKIDVGLIMLEASADDRKALKEYCKKNNLSMPDVKMSVYKNRRGRYKNILLWCSADRGICRINPIFATDYQYNPVEIKNLKIKVKPNEEGMF